MKKLLLLAFILIFSQNKAQEFKMINWDELQNIVLQNDSTLYVVNFWATWCKPCIEELPGFMEVNRQNADNPKFKMILVSLDHKKSQKKVKNFIIKHEIEAEVYLLDENRPLMEWMKLADENWAGAIPTTIFYKNGEKIFFHQMSMTQYELEDLVEDGLDY
ncbi:MAG: TlpA family protein disulfide reductase [Weeksellaceae bacterium]|nr:TlpA family protein disulfide reductase [Weeksellaceae bacterium]